MNVSTAEVYRLLDDANDAVMECHRQIGILKAERDELLAACNLAVVYLHTGYPNAAMSSVRDAIAKASS